VYSIRFGFKRRSRSIHEIATPAPDFDCARHKVLQISRLIVDSKFFTLLVVDVSQQVLLGDITSWEQVV